MSKLSRKTILSLLFLLSALAAPFAHCEELPLPTASVNIIETSPVIDGKLDDAAWRNAMEISSFSLVGRDGISASQQTKVLVCSDEKNLYVAFECFDGNLNPVFNKLHEIKTAQTARDSQVFNDDCVELFLSPDSEKGYCHIAVNGKGTVYDAYCPSKDDRKTSWNGDITVKTSMNEKMWIVELAIPFASLNTGKPLAKASWKANFCREQKGFKEDSSWSYIATGGFHNPERFGTLMFNYDAPALRSPSQISFKQGENTLSLKAFARKATKISIETRVAYANADTVTSREIFDIASGENSLDKKYIVFSGADKRKKSESISLSYRVFDEANNNLLYVSPVSVTALQTYRPFLSRFMSYCNGSSIFYHRKELYICQNTVQYLLLVVQTAKKDITNGRFILEVPSFVTLVNPISDEKKAAQPKSVAAKNIQREGVNYTRYTFGVGKDAIFPMDASPLKIPNVAILLEVKAAPDIPQKSMVYFHAEGESGNETVREPENRMPLTVLPPLVRKSPVSIPIINCFAAKGSLSALSPAERDKVFMTWSSAGFNMNIVNERFVTDPAKTFLCEDVKKIKNLGMEPIRGLPLNKKDRNIWEILQFPDAPQYLKEFPQYRAKTKDGKILDVVICHTHLLDANGTYRPRLRQWLGQLAKEYSLFLFDHEYPPNQPISSCYCERCLKTFQVYAQCGPASAEELSGKLADKWIDFQCYRTAQLAGVLREVIKKENAVGKFMVYSAYQSEQASTAYGVDWKYFADGIDAAMCGYGRPVDDIKKTLSALNGKPLIGGELIWTFHDNPEYNQDDVMINLFRRVTDCGGGLLVFPDFTGDGRCFYATNRIASIVADYEDFFLGFSRNDDLAGAAGVSPGDIVVLVNKAGARLVFCFNPTARTRDFVLSNQRLADGMTAYSVETKERFANPSAIKVSIPPKDVRVFYIGIQK